MCKTKLQGFNIRNFTGDVDACASFWLNGVEISFSSIGYSKGFCLNEVVVYDEYGNALELFRTTVEDAVKWVIENVVDGNVIK